MLLGVLRNEREKCRWCKDLAEAIKFIDVGSMQAAPWSKTGGLGDVCGSLPPALAARGHRVMVVSPRYGDYKDVHDSGLRVCYSIAIALHRSTAKGATCHELQNCGNLP